MIPFKNKVRSILRDRHISITRFEQDTGIYRHLFYRDNKPNRTTVYALAYVLGMKVEDLVAGTELEDDWSY